MADGLIGLFLGILIGGTFGVFCMALAVAAGNADIMAGFKERRGADGKDDQN